MLVIGRSFLSNGRRGEEITEEGITEGEVSSRNRNSRRGRNNSRWNNSNGSRNNNRRGRSSN